MKVNLTKLAVIALFLPRTVFSIPVYAVCVTILATNKKNFAITTFRVISCFFALLSTITVVSLFYRTSYTAFILEYILILPLLLLLFNPFRHFFRNERYLIQANYLAFHLSLINIVINFGFPFQLPYIHFLPDAIASLWGNGGAKIVTIVGFLGILYSITIKKKTDRLFVIVCLSNFLTPSFNVGILCGLIALLVLFSVRMPLKYFIYMLFSIFLIGLLIGPYIIYRIETLNLLFVKEFGVHPKLYGYGKILDIATNEPVIAILGTGLGNFSGTAALWASDYIAMISSHQRPEIPGLYASEIHTNYLGPALQLISVDRWSLSSTLNKPYSSFTTLLIELGLPLGAFIIMRFAKVLRCSNFDRNFSLGLLVFIFAIFTLDNLHSNSLFWGVIILSMRAAITNKIENS